MQKTDDYTVSGKLNNSETHKKKKPTTTHKPLCCSSKFHSLTNRFAPNLCLLTGWSNLLFLILIMTLFWLNC